MPSSFHCSLITPEQQLFEGPVDYASIPAWDGLLGVMHQRAPIVVQLGNGPLRLDLPEGKKQWFFIGRGFAQMKDNHLSLVANEAVARDQIDPREAEASLKEAQARVATGDEQIARRQRDIERARAMLAMR